MARGDGENPFLTVKSLCNETIDMNLRLAVLEPSFTGNFLGTSGRHDETAARNRCE